MSKHSYLKLFISFFLFSYIFFVFNIKSVNALVSPPEFPSCLNPIGSLVASFSSGVHGIPGNAETFQGSDSVFSVSQNSLIQCFCPANGSGIQTNWWKIPELSGSDIEIFKSQGWVFIPDGSLWGLDAVPYLAKNLSFSCSQGGGGGGGGGSSGSGGSGGGGGGGNVLGEVLGLAFTGNIIYIYGLTLTGISLISLGLFLKKFLSKK